MSVKFDIQVTRLPFAFFSHAIKHPMQSITLLFAATLPHILATNERCLGTLTAISYSFLSIDQRAMDFGYLSTEILVSHEESKLLSSAFWDTISELKKCPDLYSPLIASACEGTEVENEAYAWASAVILESERGQFEALHEMENACYSETASKRRDHREKCLTKLLKSENNAAWEEDFKASCSLEHKAWKLKDGWNDSDGRNLFVGTYERIVQSETETLTGKLLETTIKIAMKMRETNPLKQLFEEAEGLLTTRRIEYACPKIG